MVLVPVIHAHRYRLGGVQILLHWQRREIYKILFRQCVWDRLACVLIHWLVNIYFLILFWRVKITTILSIMFFICNIHYLFRAASHDFIPRNFFWSCSLFYFLLRIHLKLLGLRRVICNAHSFYSLLNFTYRFLLESCSLDRRHVADNIEFYFGRPGANYLLGLLGTLQFSICNYVDLVLLKSLWAKLIDTGTSIVLLNGCWSYKVVSWIVAIK